ncbi:hypothetical protein F2Q70_00030153 [Brassica cretica]|uniref:Uncharacterized protein n=2 Tax=Brassica TaxID=3705 RepID=A0A3N6T3U6_BRACR|nr:hypothetical protein F2Q70_00030153 [Brassica cretica]KAF3592171.1 hypothetical protein DY000_02022485 [Brassica cretica]CAF1961213.1 unnamed protein product [Brassica napus]
MLRSYTRNLASKNPVVVSEGDVTDTDETEAWLAQVTITDWLNHTRREEGRERRE